MHREAGYLSHTLLSPRQGGNKQPLRKRVSNAISALTGRHFISLHTGNLKDVADYSMCYCSNLNFFAAAGILCVCVCVQRAT